MQRFTPKAHTLQQKSLQKAFHPPFPAGIVSAAELDAVPFHMHASLVSTKWPSIYSYVLAGRVSAAELEGAMTFLREQLSSEELQLLLTQVGHDSWDTDSSRP